MREKVISLPNIEREYFHPKHISVEIFNVSVNHKLIPNSKRDQIQFLCFELHYWPLNWRNGKYVHILSRTFFLNLEMHQYWTRFQGSSNTLIVNTISFSGVQYEARIRKIFKRAYQTIRQIKVILYAIKTMYAILKLGIVMVLVFNGGSNMLF